MLTKRFFLSALPRGASNNALPRHPIRCLTGRLPAEIWIVGRDKTCFCRKLTLAPRAGERNAVHIVGAFSADWRAVLRRSGFGAPGLCLIPTDVP